MPVFKIHHITRYEYGSPVSESINEIRTFPYQCEEQEVLQHDLIISSQPDVQIYTDYFGNKAGIFSIVEPHSKLSIENKLIVRTIASSTLRINFHSGFDDLEHEAMESLLLMELNRPDNIEKQSDIIEIISGIKAPGKSVAHTVESCSEYVFKYFKYIKGITTIESTVDEILEHKGGVCQDFAHVLLQMLRSIGIPCRYVSGYICPNKNGMRGEGATHAWVEAWIPKHGWAGIDPTNNIWVTNNHIKLAVGRNFTDCTPVKGTFKGMARQSLYVFVSVGYEDGHTFQETNEVQMDKQKELPEEETPVLVVKALPTQQQQQ